MAKKKETASSAPNPAPETPRQPNDIDMNYLSKAVDARNSGQPFYVKPDLVVIWTTMAGGPHIEFNPNMTDDKGGIASRASDAGVAYFNSRQTPANPAPAPAWGVTQPNPAPQGAPMQNAPQTAPQAQPAAPSGPPKYQFQAGIEMPAFTTFGAGRKVNYGFELMEIGQSFFVPATEDMPEPIKNMSPVCGKARENLAPKEFRPRTVTENGVKGCRVWRTR